MWRVGWLGGWRVFVVICRAKRTELRDVVFALNVCGEFCVIGRVFHVAQSKHFIRVRRISIKLKLAHIHIYIVHVLHTNFELCIVYGGCCWVAVPFFYYTRYICVFVYISKEESWQNKGGFVWTSLRVCGRSVCVCVCEQIQLIPKHIIPSAFACLGSAATCSHCRISSWQRQPAAQHRVYASGRTSFRDRRNLRWLMAQRIPPSLCLGYTSNVSAAPQSTNMGPFFKGNNENVCDSILWLYVYSTSKTLSFSQKMFLVAFKYERISEQHWVLVLDLVYFSRGHFRIIITPYLYIVNIACAWWMS